MGRKVAVKILPLAKAEDPTALARFYREGRASGTLDHPNIVHTYDNGQEGDIHFLVMEYVDGCNLQAIVQRHGPMAIGRAAAYIRQAAVGLQHVHQAGLIHRDIKPGNLLLDRRGAIKILDLGLARFFHDNQDKLTQQYDHTTILGTADYLSPEQTLDSHDVDTRTDIYGLGATFYLLLAGRPPFEAKAVSQKLLAHLMKEPTPLQKLRAEVPEELAGVIQKMMAKDRDHRYQSAAAVVAALAPWTQTSMLPPPAHEMPQLCLAARSAAPGEAGFVPTAAGETSKSIFRDGKEPRTYILHAGERKRAQAESPTARIERAQAIGRAASRTLSPCRGDPNSKYGSPTPGLPSNPTPDQGRRVPGRQQGADTINSISGIDTRPDLHESMQPAPAKHWSKEQLRKLKAVCLVAALLSGVGLHALLSRARTLSGAPKSPPEASQPAVPNAKKNLRRSSDVDSISALKSEARKKSLPKDRRSESPFAVYTKVTPSMGGTP
jgi:serine/threonine protein kinase